MRVGLPTVETRERGVGFGGGGAGRGITVGGAAAKSVTARVTPPTRVEQARAHRTTRVPQGPVLP